MAASSWPWARAGGKLKPSSRRIRFTSKGSLSFGSSNFAPANARTIFRDESRRLINRSSSQGRASCDWCDISVIDDRKKAHSREADPGSLLRCFSAAEVASAHPSNSAKSWPAGSFHLARDEPTEDSRRRIDESRGIHRAD